MAAFVYKYETVKKVKEELKNKAMKALAEIEDQIMNCKNEITEFKNELKQIRESNTSAGVKISEIVFNRGCQSVVEKKIKFHNVMLNQLNTKRETVLSELTQKAKEHKIFNILEENCREQFKKEQDKIEMNMMDEIAVQKFVRQEE